MRRRKYRHSTTPAADVPTATDMRLKWVAAGSVAAPVSQESSACRIIPNPTRAVTAPPPTVASVSQTQRRADPLSVAANPSQCVHHTTPPTTVTASDDRTASRHSPA